MKQHGMVLFVDDNPAVRVAGQQVLELAGLPVIACASAEQALRHLSCDWPGVLISDVRMPGMDGLTLMKQTQSLDADIPVILVTGHGDIAMAVRAIRDGAYDFIEKPYPPELLIDAVRRALERRGLIIENRLLKAELADLSGSKKTIIGRTLAVERMRARITRIGDTNADVLITGETGAGKEVVARALHEQSIRRRKNKFVALNCGGLPENIFESELFGHKRGAFTGAMADRVGRIQYAHGGTLFLDEIESMPLQLQVKLLRVIQERVLEPLGGNDSIPVDIRVIAATKLDIKQLVDEGRFRADLYFRLNVATINIPPLRERREDIPLLFQHFINLAASRFQCEAPEPEPVLMSRLMSHDWPGNVRELRNVAERFILGLNDDLAEDAGRNRVDSNHLTLAEQVDLFEKTVIERELVQQKGNIELTINALGIPRRTFHDKLRRHGLRRDDYVE